MNATFQPKSLEDAIEYGSLADFHMKVVAEIAPRALERRTAEIIRAADAGQPPIVVLIPDLDHLICEGYYWRQVERMIRTLLEPDFMKAGSKPTSIGCHPRGRCYARVDSRVV